MTRSLLRVASLFVLIFLVTPATFAQVATGVPPFASTGGSAFDTFDLANLNVHLSIPIVNKAGRGLPFNYVLTYDNSVWSPSTAGIYGAWTPVSNWGWRGVSEAATGYLSYSTASSCRLLGGTVYANWVYHDAAGVQHPFGGFQLLDSSRCRGSSDSGGALATDDSGFYINANTTNLPAATVTSVSGTVYNPPLQSATGSGTVTDANGNRVTTTFDGTATTTFTDTLGTTALTVVAPAPPSSANYTYAGPSGNQTFVVKYTPKTVQTNFGCSNVTEYGATSTNLITEIDLPDVAVHPNDKYTFSYEATNGYPGSVTGRLASVTLPTGGTISYSYSGGSNGIICADGSTATLTRVVNDNNGNNSTWTYVHSENGAAWTTNITDPQNNPTLMYFTGLYETERANNLETVYTCYNGASSPCNGASITLPITSRVVDTSVNGLESETATGYNSYGLPLTVMESDFGTMGVFNVLRQTVTTYANLGNNIVDHPATVTVENATGGILSQKQIWYDQTGVTGTSGTPQLVSVSGSRGNPTTVSNSGQNMSTLTRTFSYFDTGNVKTITDFNLQPTNYTYGACGNSFLTSITPPAGPARAVTWDCTGGVVTSVNDGNGTTSYGHMDPFWRVTSITDPTNAVTSISYTPNSVESTLNFNGSLSTVDKRTTLDGLGRSIVSQREQSQGSGSYDSVQTVYDSLGRPIKISPSYSAAAGIAYGGATWNQTNYDALNRPTSTTDAGGGSVAFSYLKNDVLSTVGPAPGQENPKKHQYEYDALGRLTSVCEITSATGSGACTQKTSAIGFFTSYTYDLLDHLTAVSQSGQSRSYGYDAAGRLLSETNPEAYRTNPNDTAIVYTYDSDSTCGNPSAGDMIKRVDVMGNVTCYAYDGAHRPLSITYPSGTYASVTPAKHFVYDSATVNGVVMTNTAGLLAEAYTVLNGNTQTVLGFSYSARGEVTDTYEATPHSGGYYHNNTTYWANGLSDVVNLYSGNNAVIPQLTYSPEGEGRINTVGASGQNPVTSTSYNLYATPPNVVAAFGSGDSDIFTYDANTGRMTGYQFNIGSPVKSVVGTLAWNANGTLNQLAITDPINSSNQQTCNYTYDDLARVATANCAPNWNQSFFADTFGNLFKTGLGGGATSFQPTYNLATNRVSQVGNFTPPYDANGNLLGDSLQTYAWDAEGKAVTMGGVSLTYDALGRMVEQSIGSAYAQIVYGTGGGKLALMNGQTLAKAFIPLSGGATAVFNSSGLAYYRHADWLGSSRFASTPSQAMSYDGAYAPYGENYAEVGTTDRVFAGMNQDTISSGPYPLYDALYREQHSAWGRWLSPDPGGRGAAMPGNPQSWNRYAYVSNNPLALFDPMGLGPQNDPCAQRPDSVVCGRTPGSNIGEEPGSYWDSFDLMMIDLYEVGFGSDDEGVVLWSRLLGNGLDLLPLDQPPGNFDALVPTVVSKGCVDPRNAKPRSFIAANLEVAQQLALQVGTTPANILGLSGNESGWGGGPLILAGTNNYFSLTAGPAFGGTIGTYQMGTYTFGKYPSPGFLTSGQSWADSHFGVRVAGITGPMAFVEALNAGGKFNSEHVGTPYENRIVAAIKLANTLIPCPK